jgi:hypothetical protein
MNRFLTGGGLCKWVAADFRTVFWTPKSGAGKRFSGRD